VQLAVPLTGPQPGQRYALVVFRAEARLFERPTAEVLQLFGLQMDTAAFYRAAVQATADKGWMLADLAQRAGERRIRG
jgi:hypothetical protein